MVASKIFVIFAIFVLTGRSMAQLSTSTTTSTTTASPDGASTTTTVAGGATGVTDQGASASTVAGETTTTAFSTTVGGQLTQGSGISGGALDSCSQNCLVQNVQNPTLYDKFFKLLSQSEYTTVCSEITAIQSCIANCSPNCLTATMPMYTQSCKAGYQNFTNLYDCMNAMASTYNDIYTKCQQQCASNNIPSRARRQAISQGTNSDSVFCITQCGMSQELPMISNKCTPFVTELANFLAQTYDNLSTGSPQCLNPNASS